MPKLVHILFRRHVSAPHELSDEQGHSPGILMFLGMAEGLWEISKRKMQRAILGQLRGARYALSGPPLSHSPSPDRF
jgi:hypothetical protein